MNPVIDTEEFSRPSFQHPDFPTGHNRFVQIFRDHWEPWCYHRLESEVPANQRAYVKNVVERLMLCRDPEGGFALYVCPGCGFEHKVPFSCKTRFCPSCGKIHVDNWVNNITRDILEVPHLHITLTTDDSFRPFFREDSQLLDELFKVGAEAVKQVVLELYPGMQIRMIYTVHTFGRGLGYKPHVHLIITMGGMVDGKWVEIDSVPGDRLSKIWRKLLCEKLRKIRSSDAALLKVIDKTFKDHHGFVVHTESFYPKGIEAARYIGRYLGHPPLATSHLTGYDGKTVTFWYIDTETGFRKEVRCSGMDFISLMIPHIPPKGMQMVRYAGLYAHCIKHKIATVANTALEALRVQIPLFVLEPLLKVPLPLKWRERIKASFGYDPLSCPRCGRTMELAEIWEPKRGHIWMRQWLETHRLLKAARDALKNAAQAKRPTPNPILSRNYQQLSLAWNTS